MFSLEALARTRAWRRPLPLVLWVIAGMSMGGYAPGQTDHERAFRRDVLAVDVVVVGLAPIDVADRAEVARRDAMRKAVEQVVGQQVKASVLTANNQLIDSKIYARTEGYVKEARPLGNPEELGQGDEAVFAQRYSITVYAGTINNDLVYEGVDVEFLYDVVSRPRIAFFIERAGEGPGGRDRDTETALQADFKSRNPNFELKNLDVLAGSAHREVDWVAVGLKGGVDMVVSGETEVKIAAKVAVNVGTVRVDLYRAAVTVNLSITHMANGGLVDAVRVTFDGTDEASLADMRKHGGTASDAQNWAYSQAMAQAQQQLWVKLMRAWVRSVYDVPYEIVFRQAKAADSNDFSRQLTAVGPVKVESVQMRGAVDGQLVFDVKVDGTLPELLGSLAEQFPTYRSGEARVGRVVMLPAAGPGAELTITQLTILNCNWGQVTEFEKALGRINGVHEARKTGFENATAAYSIRHELSLADLATQIETALPISLTKVGQDGIEGKIPLARDGD